MGAAVAPAPATRCAGRRRERQRRRRQRQWLRWWCAVVLRCSHGLVCVGESEGDTEEGVVRSRGVFAVVSGGQFGASCACG